MAQRFLSVLSFTLIFALSTGPLVVAAQAEVPEAPPLEVSIVEASSIEPAPSEAAVEPAVTVKVQPELGIAETIDPATYVAGEVIVKYKESHIDLTDSADQKSAAAIVEALELTTTETIDAQNIAVVATEGTSLEQAIELLETDPNVAYAKPNYVRSIDTLSSTSPELTNLWALQNTAQTLNSTTGIADADTDALEAWSIATGTDIIVAVIDTGVDYTHSDLADNMWEGSACVDENGGLLGGCLHGYDFEDNDTDPLPTGTDSASEHGTHVAGIIAGTQNDTGIVGIAPGVKIMALKFGLDVASEIRAINFARQNGARIINASYSGSVADVDERAAIEAFQSAGGIFVASAANDGLDVNNGVNDSPYPSSHDLPGIISVAASTQRDALASYSNYGAISVDLGAPGSNIYSTIPSNGYGYKSGTSMSAPMVAGAVALAKSYRPDLSAAAIKAAVLDSGDPLASLATTTVSGKRLNVNNMLLSLAPTIPIPDTTAPVITLLGSNPLALTVGNSFTDPGAEVTDDTDTTQTIIGSGTVDTATAGTYTLTYSATDTAGNVATSSTRSIVVSAAAVVSSGGGGGSSSRRSGGGGGGSTTITRPKVVEPSVPRYLTSSTPTPQVLGASTFIFSRDLSAGATGEDVTELQKTLAKLGFYSGPISGFFGPLTESALRAFQQSKGLEPAGRMGPQTRALLNGNTGQATPTTNTAAIISTLQAQLQVLLAQLALLQAKST